MQAVELIARPPYESRNGSLPMRSIGPLQDGLQLLPEVAHVVEELARLVVHVLPQLCVLCFLVFNRERHTRRCASVRKKTSYVRKQRDQGLGVHVHTQWDQGVGGALHALEFQCAQRDSLSVFVPLI